MSKGIYASVLAVSMFFSTVACGATVNRGDNTPVKRHNRITSTLQYFGYCGLTGEDNLNRTSEYTNFVYLGTNMNDEAFQPNMDGMLRHKQIGILNIAPIVWDFNVWPPARYVDWQDRVNSWRQKNIEYIIPNRVLAISVFDEPSNVGMLVLGYDEVCQFIKEIYPWVKILHVDGCSSASKYNIISYFNAGGRLRYVDWLAIDYYSIHPEFNAEYRSLISSYKHMFPDRKWLYVIDGFWDKNHEDALGSIHYMGQIATEYQTLALNDTDAIGLGVFLWEGGDAGWITSKNMPLHIIETHKTIGMKIKLDFPTP